MSEPDQGQKRDFGELNRTIGERIRTRRESRTWTAAEVGERIGVHLQTVLRLESGAATVAPKYIELFAELFECSPHDLLPPDETTIPLSGDERRLLAAVRSGNRVAVRRAVADCLGDPTWSVEANPDVAAYLRTAAQALTTAAAMLGGDE